LAIDARVRFVLAVEHDFRELHALRPGEIAGPALCGHRSPDGWTLNGFTADLARIGCRECLKHAALLAG
jgi:hypothetical protein